MILLGALPPELPCGSANRLGGTLPKGLLLGDLRLLLPLLPMLAVLAGGETGRSSGLALLSASRLALVEACLCASLRTSLAVGGLIGRPMYTIFPLSLPSGTATTILLDFCVGEELSTDGGMAFDAVSFDASKLVAALL